LPSSFETPAFGGLLRMRLRDDASRLLRMRLRDGASRLLRMRLRDGAFRDLSG
jgi:hypothetical protein